MASAYLLPSEPEQKIPPRTSADRKMKSVFSLLRYGHPAPFQERPRGRPRTGAVHLAPNQRIAIHLEWSLWPQPKRLGHLNVGSKMLLSTIIAHGMESVLPPNI